MDSTFQMIAGSVHRSVDSFGGLGIRCLVPDTVRAAEAAVS